MRDEHTGTCHFTSPWADCGARRQPRSTVASVNLNQQRGELGVHTRNSDSKILVMQPADHSLRHDAPDALDRARDRRILVQ
jgi:hypothetical protein